MSARQSDERAADRERAILEALREAGDDYVSGRALAEQLGVSRTAVAKRIDGLRERGWRIEAAARRGYRLLAEADSLHALAVQPLLQTRWLGRRYEYHLQLDSTNDALTALARQAAPHGTVVVADEQRRGRGRQGRSWASPPGENLYFSLLLRPEWPPGAVPPISLAAAVGVAHGLARFFDRPPTVKWPNDLLCDGRKLCGILVEMAAELDRVIHVVVGVGINVNQRRFPGELEPIATSLARELGRTVSRPAVLAAVLAGLESWLDALLAGATERVLDEWTQLADWLGQRVTVLSANQQLRGIALGIDRDGALRLRDDRGEEHRVLAGDVHLLRT